MSKKKKPFIDILKWYCIITEIYKKKDHEMSGADNAATFNCFFRNYLKKPWQIYTGGRLLPLSYNYIHTMYMYNDYTYKCK